MEAIQHGNNIRLVGNCLRCHAHIVVEISGDDFEGWISGAIKTQDIKNINIDEKEWLISQICGPCFDTITKDDS